MDYTVIQEHVNRLSDMMLAKGLRQPRAEFELRSHSAPRVILAWENRNKRPGDFGNYQFFDKGAVGEMLAAAELFIAKQPSADETKFREFIGALGCVIDLGNENGIEVEFLNPLVATMKILSKNALAYQPQATA
jgi:hypothetical protein